MTCAAIDLFCGIGGLTHGLRLAGIPVCAGFDIDNSCKYAYEANNESKFIQADIETLLQDDILQYYPDNAIKILVGCAPCQPFSKYTQRYRKKGHTDNKWKLLNSFSRLIGEIQPEIISMENVPELITQSIFYDFIKELQKNSYYVSYKIVYCPDYNISQGRKRLVLLASKLGEINLIPPICTPEQRPTVRDVIGCLPPIDAGIDNTEDPLHCSSKLSDINIRRIVNSVPGGSWRDWPEDLRLPCHKKNSGRTYPAVYGRMKWDEPAPTITTQFYGYGNGRFGHPEQNRALSLREGAMLQSFPQNYLFVEKGKRINKRELGIHIGNAVPVNLGLAIGLTIKKHLNGD